jgi:mannosyltransferase OCH1-like enzyme
MKLKKRGSGMLKMKIVFLFLIGTAHVLFADTIWHQNFHDCMTYNLKYSMEKAIEKEDWRFVHSLYSTLVSQTTYAKTPYIPKIIHQIWLGSPFPEKYKKWQESWIKYNPDWQYKLWTEKEINELGLQNRALYDAAKNYGKKSDIARYEILYRFGGVYVDTDFECLKSFDILHHSCDFYAGLAYSAGVILYNGLIGSRAGHPILNHCIQNLKESAENTSQAILQGTGPHHLSRAFRQQVKTCGGFPVAFPVSYFYPWPEYSRLDIVNDRYSWTRPESFAVHHWEVSWRPPSELKSYIIWED